MRQPPGRILPGRILPGRTARPSRGRGRRLRRRPASQAREHSGLRGAPHAGCGGGGRQRSQRVRLALSVADAGKLDTVAVRGRRRSAPGLELGARPCGVDLFFGGGVAVGVWCAGVR